MDLDFRPWQRRLWVTFLLGPIAFELGQALAGWLYDHLRRHP